MRTKHAIAVAGVGLSLTVTPMRAHHAFSAEFDIDKPLTLKGTMVKWEMVNPHSWFHIEVKDADGSVVEWMVEGGSPNSLIRQGVTKNNIKIGMELTIEGYQAKDGTRKAVGRNFVLPDGRRLFFGSQIPDPKSPPRDVQEGGVYRSAR